MTEHRTPMLGGYWILDSEKRPVQVDSVIEWGQFFESQDRIVKQEHIGDVRVSTVFLGIDHGWFDSGPPVLFETMIFGGEHDQWQDRCSTWKEAEHMHEQACAMVRGKSS